MILFSLLLCIAVTVLLLHFQHGYGLFESGRHVAMDDFRRRLLKQGELEAEQYESLEKYGILKVNTSLYVK